MKNKYQRLTSKEKKELVKEFRAENKKNNDYMRTLNRMKLYGILGVIYSIVAILGDIFVLNAAVWSYAVDGIVGVFSIYLLIQRSSIKTAVLNNYLIGKGNTNAETTPKKRRHVSKNVKAKKSVAIANKIEEIAVEEPKTVKKEVEKKPAAKKETVKKVETKKITETAKKEVKKETKTVKKAVKEEKTKVEKKPATKKETVKKASEKPTTATKKTTKKTK